MLNPAQVQALKSVADWQQEFIANPQLIVINSRVDAEAVLDVFDRLPVANPRTLDSVETRAFLQAALMGALEITATVSSMLKEVVYKVIDRLPLDGKVKKVIKRLGDAAYRRYFVTPKEEMFTKPKVFQFAVNAIRLNYRGTFESIRKSATDAEYEETYTLR